MIPSSRSFALLLLLTPLGCGSPESDAYPAGGSGDDAEAGTVAEWPEALGPETRVLVVEGLNEPESVKYDPGQDVYFVSGFSGESGERDSNGAIARVRAEDGSVESMDFATGTPEAPFHSGRGMALQGDTLWVADIDGVHGFHRETGAQLAFVDLSETEPGFLNDIGVADDGSVWVTDTGGWRVIQVRPEAGVIGIEGDDSGNPNGILWSPQVGGFLLAPWRGGGDGVRLWVPGSESSRVIATSAGRERFDGLEIWDDRLLAAVQSDSAIHVFEEGVGRPLIKLPGRPADLGLDTRRGRLAVPYVALDRVEVWQLPR
jgi:sugar lactone lactonase YvrE